MCVLHTFHAARIYRSCPTCVISESLWSLARDAPWRLSVYGVTNSFTRRETVRPLPLVATVHRNISWQFEKRYEPKFILTSALRKVWKHGSKYKVCPFFLHLIEKEMRNKPRPGKACTKLNNRQPPNMGRGRGTFKPVYSQRSLFIAFNGCAPVGPGNAWSRPLNVATSVSKASSTILEFKPTARPFRQNTCLYLTQNFHAGKIRGLPINRAAPVACLPNF
jgi:hypothetical protein